MDKKPFRLPETLAELLKDPSVLKVARGSPPTRELASREDIAFGTNTIDDALRALEKWKAGRKAR
jgi:hypothetical protein